MLKISGEVTALSDNALLSLPSETVESTALHLSWFCVCQGASLRLLLRDLSHSVKKGINLRKDGLFWLRVLRG